MSLALHRLIGTVLLLLVLGLPGARAAPALIQTIDIPTAEGVIGLTAFQAISDVGTILGHDLSTGTSYLLTLTQAGAPTPTLQTIRCPETPETVGEALNRFGDVVGWCGPAGFLRTRTGVIRLLRHPDTVALHTRTLATGINRSRQIVGIWEESTGPRQHGFLWQQGVFTALDAPFPDAAHTLPMAINDAGTVVGATVAPVGADGIIRVAGFVWHRGQWTRLDVPLPGVEATTPFDISTNGHILGSYETADSWHNFVYIDGTFYTVAIPAPSIVLTGLTGMNRHGQLVGWRQLLIGTAPTQDVVNHGVLATWEPPPAQVLAPTVAMQSRTALVEGASHSLSRQERCAQWQQIGLLRSGRLRALALRCGGQ